MVSQPARLESPSSRSILASPIRAPVRGYVVTCSSTTRPLALRLAPPGEVFGEARVGGAMRSD